MNETLVTMKGTTTIPKEVRDELGLRPGDRVAWVKGRGGGYTLQKRLGPSPFKRYRGYLKHLKGRDPDKMVNEMRGR